MKGRVKWMHDCPSGGGTCGYDQGGTVWVPNDAIRAEHPGASDYQIAAALGLTVDPASCGEVMVDWDCRPGALQAHHAAELEALDV